MSTVSSAEDVVPRLLASPEQSPEQVADTTIAALQRKGAEPLGEEMVETTLDLFTDIFNVVMSDDALAVPNVASAIVSGPASS